MDLPGKALSPGMRSSLEPMDFSPGAAAVHEEEEEAKKSLFFFLIVQLFRIAAGVR